MLSCLVMYVSLRPPWTVALQAPLSMEFSRQWSGLPFPSPGDLPNPEIEPRDQTHVSWISCIGKQILYHCTTWEALGSEY